MPRDFSALKLFDFPLKTEPIKYKATKPASTKAQKTKAQKTPISQERVLDEHGNTTLAYSGKSPWHEIGTKMGGPEYKDVTAAMKAAKLDGLSFEVVPAYDANQVVAEDVNLVRCSFTNKPLPGVAVGKRFRAIQPLEAFEVMQDLITGEEYVIDTIGAVDDYSKIWMRLETTPVSLLGKERLMRAILVCFGNTGKMAYLVIPSMVREVSSSTVHHSITNMLKRVDPLRVKHTKNYASRLHDIQQAFARSHYRWEDLLKSFEAMAHRQVSVSEVKRFTEDFLPAKSKRSGVPLQTAKKRAKVIRAFESSPGSNLRTAKGTVWGLYNAAAYYLDWQRTMRGSVTNGERWYTSAVFGPGERMRQRAAKIAMQLVLGGIT